MGLPARLLAPLCLLLLAGCASGPRAPETAARGERVAARALAAVGQAYRFGGEGDRGFDCSGLALHVHDAEGVAIPRTAAAQFRDGVRISRESLRAGDLVFFRFGRGGVDHVGVYVGEGSFVHAPGRGETVRRVRLEAPWFSRRFAGATRYWDR